MGKPDRFNRRSDVVHSLSMENLLFIVDKATKQSNCTSERPLASKSSKQPVAVGRPLPADAVPSLSMFTFKPPSLEAINHVASQPPGITSGKEMGSIQMSSTRRNLSVTNTVLTPSSTSTMDDGGGLAFLDSSVQVSQSP